MSASNTLTLPVFPRRVYTPLNWSRLTQGARRRWRATWALAALWLLDAALQFQPFMFTRGFPDQVIAPAGQGSPEWVAGPVRWSAQLLADHVVIFNALFATVQLLIAIGLFLPATVRLALAASIGWALMVWWLGEGLGGTLAGPVSPLMGFPGAVILYAWIALLVWPRRPTPSVQMPVSVASRGLLGARGAKALWLLFWFSCAFEALRPAERTPGALSSMVTGMGSGEPGWLGAINSTLGRALAGHGSAYSIGLGALCALIGLSVLVSRLTRAGLVLAVLLALAIWIVGEDLGEIATGTGTDPNSGLPLVLLAACYWPRAQRAGDPSGLAPVPAPR